MLHKYSTSFLSSSAQSVCSGHTNVHLFFLLCLWLCFPSVPRTPFPFSTLPTSTLPSRLVSKFTSSIFPDAPKQNQLLLHLHLPCMCLRFRTYIIFVISFSVCLSARQGCRLRNHPYISLKCILGLCIFEETLSVFREFTIYS